MSKLFIPTVPDITKMRIAPLRQSEEQAADNVAFRAKAIWREVAFNRPSEDRKAQLRAELMALTGL